MADDAPLTTPSPWTLDARGYLLTPSGAKAARLTEHGILYLWDARERVERPFTLDDWQNCTTRTEPTDRR
jgi:hypothetical protein